LCGSTQHLGGEEYSDEHLACDGRDELDVVNEQLLRYLLDVPVIGPSDIIESIVYLSGQAGRYLTGDTLPADAGRTVKWCCDGRSPSRRHTGDTSAIEKGFL
jgi:hypothetical protein